MLRDKLGDRFLGGVVLYLGERSYISEDRLHVIPLERLWTGLSSSARSGGPSAAGRS